MLYFNIMIRKSYTKIKAYIDANPYLTGKRLLLISAAVICSFFLGIYLYFTIGLPSVVALKDYQPNLVTKAYSKDGELIGEFYIERRVVVPLAKMPTHLIDAFLAAEDAKFFEHEGVSYSSIIRAFYKNLKAGRIVQGGSTITQQVARSFFLTKEKKLSRKIREVFMAYRIEKYLSKEEILNLYLNQIYLGNGAYGVQAAADTYFGKSVEELNVAESALLAALPKAPSTYSPYINFDRAKERQEFVLDRMVAENFLPAGASIQAADQELKLKPREVKSLWTGPYFTEHIRRYIEEKYGDELLYRGGLNIYTTMDLNLQKVANEAVDFGLRAYDKRRGYRGPVAELSTVEEIDEFRAEMETALESSPLVLDGIYKGVVLSVEKKAKSLHVAIGAGSGVIKWKDLQWARVYNPEAAPDGEEVDDPLAHFKTGDVVNVRVKELPKEDGDPIQLSLEQEPLVEAALLAIEPETGYVRAMVGGSDFSKTQFNRTVQAMRQPGSAFKPIIYSTALDHKYTPASIVMDTPIVFDDTVNDVKWRPRNYDEQFHGPTTVRKAITSSRNIVTIKVLQDIGVSSVIEYAHKLGIRSPLADDLSLALGSSALTIEEMTTVFSTFANLGYRPEPQYITKITDKDGNVIEENIPTSEQVLSPETAYMMTNLLQGVIQNGTGRRARALGRPAAGKTGTTNNLNDAWFLGYVPDLVAGVWVGYDDEKKLGKHETGSRAAIPIWLKFMKGATKGTPVKNFVVPDGVEFAKIDQETGLLAAPDSTNVIFEVFKTGTAPTEVSTPREQPGATDFTIIEAGGVPPEAQGPSVTAAEELLDSEDPDSGPLYDENPELMQQMD